MLLKEEKERYNRHIILSEIGENGQEKLKKARVLVVGAGGLGCPVLLYLTAAGIGTIGIIDFDKVSESNLQRQILFSLEDVGKLKVEVARQKLLENNPLINIDIYPEKLTANNALELFSSYDVIVDGTDNFSTRYLTNDASLITGKPLVYGSIFKFEGQVSVFNYQNGPGYRCLFPEPPKPGTVPGCSEIGVLGILPGHIGTLQANEVIKIILGLGEVLSGKLMVTNLLSMESRTLNFGRNDIEIQKVLKRKADFNSFDYDYFCGIKPERQKKMKEINASEFHEKLKNEEILVIDVREPYEQPKLNSDHVINIPMGELLNRVDEIPEEGEVVIMCQHGFRSVQAMMFLQSKYDYDNLINLKGGIVTLV